MAQSLVKVDIDLPKGSEIQHVFLKSDGLNSLYHGLKTQNNTENTPNSTAITSYNYSNSFNIFSKTTAEQLQIVYQLVNEYQGLLLYQIDSKHQVSPVLIHFPDSLYDHTHRNINLNYYTNNLNVDAILQNGMLVTMSIPLDFNLISSDFFKIYYPFDFSIREPYKLFSISADHQVVSLKDGAILGLTKHYLDGNSELASDYETVLFDKESYLQFWSKKLFSFTKHNNEKHQNHPVVSIHHLKQTNQLLTISNDMILKIWDIQFLDLNFGLSLVEETNLLESLENISEYDIHKNGSVLSYMTNDQKDLVVYLPIKSGLFQTYKIDTSSTSSQRLAKTNEFTSTMEYGTSWYLVDLKMLEETNEVICLWKGNMDGLIQIYKDNQWIDSQNESFQDSLQDIFSNGDLTSSLLNVKNHYSSIVGNKLELYESGKVAFDLEKLKTIETKCKSLKKIKDEPSSFTLKNNSMVVINNLSIFGHSLYVPSQLGTVSKGDSSIERLVSVVDEFSCEFSEDFYQEISLKFVSKTVENNLKDFIIDDLEYFKQNVSATKLDTLVSELSQMNNFIQILQKIIFNIESENGSNSVDLMTPQNFDSISLFENLHYKISVVNKIVLKLLVIFSVLEFEFSTIEKEITKLLKIHYNTSLFLSLYQLNKFKLSSDFMKKYSMFGNGFVCGNYEHLENNTNFLFYKTIHNVEFDSIFINDFVETISLNNTVVTKKFETIVAKPFSVVTDLKQQFLLGLVYFNGGKFLEAFDILFKNFKGDLPSSFISDNEIPQLSQYLSLIQSTNTAEYYYELSKKFSEHNEHKLALQSIQKSMQVYDVEREDLSLKYKQTIQYLITLDYFNMFEEILDVLMNSNDVLDYTTKSEYYSEFLIGNQSFIGIIVDNSFSNKTVLPLQDYEIIDSVLQANLQLDNFKTYLLLFSFRSSNENTRNAVECLYSYISIVTGMDNNNNSSDSYDNCKVAKTLIANVLNSYSNDTDKWFTTQDGRILTLKDL